MTNDQAYTLVIYGAITAVLSVAQLYILCFIVARLEPAHMRKYWILMLALWIIMEPFMFFGIPIAIAIRLLYCRFWRQPAKYTPVLLNPDNGKD